jgi:hypothetical protein
MIEQEMRWLSPHEHGRSLSGPRGANDAFGQTAPTNRPSSVDTMRCSLGDLRWSRLNCCQPKGAKVRRQRSSSLKALIRRFAGKVSSLRSYSPSPKECSINDLAKVAVLLRLRHPDAQIPSQGAHDQPNVLPFCLRESKGFNSISNLGLSYQGPRQPCAGAPCACPTAEAMSDTTPR